MAVPSLTLTLIPRKSNLSFPGKKFQYFLLKSSGFSHVERLPVQIHERAQCCCPRQSKRLCCWAVEATSSDPLPREQGSGGQRVTAGDKGMLT